MPSKSMKLRDDTIKHATKATKAKKASAAKRKPSRSGDYGRSLGHAVTRAGY